MVNRRQHTKEDIDHSLETRVSTPADGRPIEDERISAIYELTDISDLPEDDAKQVLKDMDFANMPLTDLVKEVQRKVKAIMPKK